MSIADLDDSLRFPPTRREIERENRVQHRDLDIYSYTDPVCLICGKAGAQLREPCAMPIGHNDGPIDAKLREDAAR
jgi:hypothetical protein